jgi:hypothetical protein
VRVKSKTATGFTVDWGGVSGATGYVVEITHSGAEVATGTRAGTTTQLSVGGLKHSTSYGIRVAATSSAGQGPWSSVHYDTTSK